MNSDPTVHFYRFLQFKSLRRCDGPESWESLRTHAIGVLACSLVFAFFMPCSARGADPVNSYIASVFQMVRKQRETLPRLIAPANATANALIRGGKFYLGGDKGFASEGSGRAGGLMMVRRLSASNPPMKGDVVWLAYEPSTYAKVAQQARALEGKGCLVVVFGPKPASGTPHFKYWIDSFTPLNASDDFTRMGNILSLWSLTGEVAASTARQGKTLVFYQTIQILTSRQRYKMYKGMAFHDGIPQMAPVAPGVLSEDYVSFIQNMLQNIREWELPKIISVGHKMARRAREGRPALLTVIAHVMPHSVNPNSKLYRYVNSQRGGGGDRLQGKLHRGDVVVFVGYAGVDLDLWREVRQQDATAAWIIAPLATEVDFSQWGDLVISQHWHDGDCAVEAPGYDIRILPPSGIAQLFIYGIMMRAAGAH